MLRRLLKITLVFILLLSMFHSFPSATEAAAKSLNVKSVKCMKGKVTSYYYLAKEKVYFVSCTKTWTKSKLFELAKEFKRNTIGKEIEALKTVIVTPYTPGNAGEAFNNWYVDSKGRPSYIPKKSSLIYLYDANRQKTVESMARVLSHEYGHVFTFYWLIKKEHKLPTSQTTGWAKTRKLSKSSYPIRWSGSRKSYSHYWAPEEIMADEYFQLFGSPTGKKKLKSQPGIDDSYPSAIENLEVPSVENNPAVLKYWTKLTGIKMKKQTHLSQPVIKEIKSIDLNYFGKNGYAISFTPATKDNKRGIQYFVEWSTQKAPNSTYFQGRSDIFKNVTRISFNAVRKNNQITLPYVPQKGMKASMRVFAYDPKTKQLTYSKPQWYDFANPKSPKKIKNQFNYKK